MRDMTFAPFTFQYAVAYLAHSSPLLLLLKR